VKYIILLSILFSSISFAGGWTGWAVPTRVDVEGVSGFMVYGAFGNSGGCTVENQFYVQKGHPQYKEIYATALAAFMGGKKVQTYIHSCGAVGWYSLSPTAFNIMGPTSALNLTH